MVSSIQIVESDGEIVELSALTENGEVRVITAMRMELGGNTLVLDKLHYRRSWQLLRSEFGVSVIWRSLLGSSST